MAEAAERRAKDAKLCGHGEGVPDPKVEEEMKKAEEDSVGVSGTSLNLNNDVDATGSPSVLEPDIEAESESGSSDLEIISSSLKPGPSKPTIRKTPATRRSPHQDPFW